MKSRNLIAVFFCCIALISCNGGNDTPDPNGNGPVSNQAEKMFRRIPASESGIGFVNRVNETNDRNYFKWMYIYNGGGVAVGDINNDGLTDIYFTGNDVPNKLFLNKGKLVFEDITAKAGVAGANWCTGATMADVNGDGFLDIYVVRGGPYIDDVWDRTNLLYINNGDLTFKESAQQWQCNDAAFGTHASFLDYDRDGDLDLYVVNHPYQFGGKIDFKVERHLKPQAFESDRFFRNDGDKFTDITETSGIMRFAFGLSATVSDINMDGWPDVYVANDFAEPDFLFINQKDGTFKDEIKKWTGHISNFGMGSDIADFNNDGLPDIAVMDMMAEDNRRKKTNMSGMNPEAFFQNVGHGFHYQYMQNTLQINTGMNWFSDLAQMSGISFTDWSWAPLFADFDNDGWQDLYVTNGYRRDARDNDYVKKVQKAGEAAIIEDFQNSLKLMPEEKIQNYMYRNKGDLTFEKTVEDWGLNGKTWSNGAAYADFDNDGDLDLVVNNLEDRADLFENRKQQIDPKHWLRVKLKMDGKNRFGYGAKVRLYDAAGELIAYRELNPSRGYQSSVDPVLHFGLGDRTKADWLEVTWPDGSVKARKDVAADQTIEIDNSPASESVPKAKAPAPIFRESKALSGTLVNRETPFDDFAKEILLPHRQSQLGPFISVGDVNGDGHADVFAGGAASRPGMIWSRETSTYYGPRKGQFIKHMAQEDMGSCLFDANGDGHLDLYVVSGSNEFGEESSMLQDRLYMNGGNGMLRMHSLPDLKASGSVVANADYDGDGDQDLFVGGRAVPGKYPYPARSYLLENDGKGNFKDVTAEKAKDAAVIGIVTDAIWSDYDGDKDPDLILTGEWMPVTIFRNDGGKLVNATAEAGLDKATGWWYSIAPLDADGDGDMDFVAGNMGLNSKFPASEAEPLQIYCHDFDENGSLDIVLGYFNEGKCYPVRGRTCSSQQMPNIKQKFPTYKEFSVATLKDVYGQDALDAALHYQATTLATSLLINEGGKYTVKPLPNEAQLSAVNAILVHDFNGDGNQDLLMAGNMFHTEVETSRADASVGLFLEGDGKGGFKPWPAHHSGFFAPWDVKDMALIERGDDPTLVVISRNDDNLFTYEVVKKAL